MSVKTFSTAEEMDAQKAENNQKRIRKLTTDRQEKNGKLVQTDGLRVIKKNNHNHDRFVVTDEEMIVDLTRVRTLQDVEKRFDE